MTTVRRPLFAALISVPLQIDANASKLARFGVRITITLLLPR
jgi:hypothetical protein